MVVSIKKMIDNQNIIYCKDPDKDMINKALVKIEESFGKKLISGYPSRAIEGILYNQLESCYAIISILEGYTYLDKLAVMPKYRGKGVGKSLLEEVITYYPHIVWRASHNNPYNSFYKSYAHHNVYLDDWILYWVGYGKNEKEIMIQKITETKPDFI